MKGARAIPTFAIRLPEDLKDWLKQRADKNRRSLSAELIVILEDRRNLDLLAN